MKDVLSHLFSKSRGAGDTFPSFAPMCYCLLFFFTLQPRACGVVTCFPEQVSSRQIISLLGREGILEAYNCPSPTSPDSCHSLLPSPSDGKHPFCALKTGSVHRKQRSPLGTGVAFWLCLSHFQCRSMRLLEAYLSSVTCHSQRGDCQTRGGHQKNKKQKNPTLALSSFLHFWSLTKMHYTMSNKSTVSLSI